MLCSITPTFSLASTIVKLTQGLISTLILTENKKLLTDLEKRDVAMVTEIESLIHWCCFTSNHFLPSSDVV